MKYISLKDLAVPLIKSVDSFNFLLKSHHRRTAIISYYIGKEMGLNKKDMIDLIIAASLHDIGAISVKERDMLIKEDVEFPGAHCEQGYKMLSSVDLFKNIAKIIKYHHVIYNDPEHSSISIPIQSYIIHLADRVEIYIDQDSFILNVKDEVIEKIQSKSGTLFNPIVYNAFFNISKADIFWIDINNMSMDELFSKVDFNLYPNFDIDQIVNFSLIFSRIIDYRSSFTAAHSYTVGEIAYNLGEILGFDREKCIKLKIAGYLHDIGKLGIDPTYLEKKSALTFDEYNKVKLHAYYTGEILKELTLTPWFKEIVFWAENHHERANGDGYPHALKNKEISNEMRIIGYADVISALMEDRPYRKGMSLEEALIMIDKTILLEQNPELLSTIKKNKENLNNIITISFKQAKYIYNN